MIIATIGIIFTLIHTHTVLSEATCPQPTCGRPGDGCYYDTANVEIDGNTGCRKYPCGKLICENDAGENQPTEAPCAKPSCIQASPGCKYIDSTEIGVGGCLKYPCGKYVCEDSSWSSWGQCSKSCDGGIKRRTCIVNNNGNLRRQLQESGCNGQRTTMCNTHLCADNEEVYEIEHIGRACDGGSKIAPPSIDTIQACANWANNRGVCSSWFTFGAGACSCQISSHQKGGTNSECDSTANDPFSNVYFIEKESALFEDDDEVYFEAEYANLICNGGRSEWLKAESPEECVHLAFESFECSMFINFGNQKCSCQLKSDFNSECEHTDELEGMNVFVLENQGALEAGEDVAEIPDGDNANSNIKMQYCDDSECDDDLCDDGKSRRPIGGNCCACPYTSKKKKIPLNCAIWFDGCNNCFVENGEIKGCTDKFCYFRGKSKCVDWRGTVNGDSNL